MTTLNYFQGTEHIVDRLEAVQARRWLLRILQGSLAVLVVAMSCVVFIGLVAGYWSEQPPAVLRWGLLFGSCFALAGALVWFLLRALVWKQNYAQTARFVEQALPDVRNDLINTVLLAGDRVQAQASPELVQMAIQEAVRRTSRMDLGKSISLKSLRNWGIAAGGAALVLTLFVLFQGDYLLRGLMAVARPTGRVAHVNALKLRELSPKDMTVFAGEAVTITAKVQNDSQSPLQAEVLIQEEGAAEFTRYPMIANAENNTFTYQTPPVLKRFFYRVRIDESVWPEEKDYYTIDLARAGVEVFQVLYRYLPYTRLPERTDGNPNIEAPVGTAATITVRLRTRTPSIVLEVAGESGVVMSPSSDHLSFTANLSVVKDTGYRLLLKDSDGRTIDQAPEMGLGFGAKVSGGSGETVLKDHYQVRAIPDARPKIEFLAPAAASVNAPPGGKVVMRVRATDDYGLSAVRLYAGAEGQETEVPDFRAGDIANKKSVEIAHSFDCGKHKVGDVISCYAVAEDNRDLKAFGLGGPQDANTGRYKITIKSPDQVAAEKAGRFEKLMQDLERLLRMQKLERIHTDQCVTKHSALDQVRKTGADIVRGQQAIKKDLDAVLKDFPPDENLREIKERLTPVAANEAQEAVAQAEVLAGLSKLEDRSSAGLSLGDTQDRIINVLLDCLARMPSLANKTDPTTRPTKGGTDLPPEAAEKLKKLENELAKFMEEQKKVIQASERLAKKPVDAFTPEDMKLINELAGVEDKWEKFMNEAFSDLSKLAQQDFSNPAVMKELISVKSDITMAKDALKEKAAEIATAAEDNGIENAKSLTANIEKWLPDKPDRQKWSMEDPKDGQTNPEQAELPTELEDLVGDLLEQEEDLFEEMEDLSSKYAQSGDKGIGWDALDGPISNMNAQGVTGNQPPNNMELQGRSGEGREGKSSGEFVEDKAVGKGGRRTPTRLTPEPFQKGEVNDQSKDPAGGATGGGKISGSGEEGLEGPVPPPLEKELQRLAGKQAALVNKAERMRAQYQMSARADGKLSETITLMNKVRGSLESYHYQNALRQSKGALDALGQSKAALSGKVDVEADTTVNMPKYYRDGIFDGMKDKRPSEFSDAVGQYFRRLNNPGGK